MEDNVSCFFKRALGFLFSQPYTFWKPPSVNFFLDPGKMGNVYKWESVWNQPWCGIDKWPFSLHSFSEHVFVVRCSIEFLYDHDVKWIKFVPVLKTANVCRKRWL